MVHDVLTWLLVAAFAVAGAVNAIGRPGVRADFVRWGYPAWWCHVTGALEAAVAVLIAVPASREAGLVLGAVVVVAAALTVARHGEFPHLAPLGAFAALLVLVQVVR